MELVNVYKTSRGVFNTEEDAMKNRAWDQDRYGKTEKESVVVQPALKVGDRYFLLSEITPK